MAADGLNMSDFLGQFQDEARELIEAATKGMLCLEKAPDDAEAAREVARAMHTLKGSARLMGFERINRLTHSLEDMLGAVRDGVIPFGPAVADLVLAGLDQIGGALERLARSGDEGMEVADLCRRIEETTKGAAVVPATPVPAPDVPRPPPPPAPTPTPPPAAETPREPASPALASDMSAFVGEFRDEVHELTTQMGEALLTIEKSPDDAAARQDLARCMHTLKGSARLMGLDRISRLTHALEDLLSEVRDGKASFSSAVADLVLQGLDRVREAVAAVVESGQERIEIDDLMARARRFRGVEGAPAPAEPAAPAVLGAAALGDAEALPADDDSAAADSAEPAQFAVFEKGLPPKKAAAPPLPAPTAAQAAAESKPAPPSSAAPPTAPAKPPPQSRTRRAATAGETIRVDTGKLDSLANVVGEMVVNLIKFADVANVVRSIVMRAKENARRCQRFRGEIVPLGGGESAAQDVARTAVEEFLDRCDSANAAIQAELERLSQHLNEDIMRVATSTRKLEQDVMSIRMHPVSMLFNTFPRAVRDLGRQLGKVINLEIEGGDTELDKKILEAIRDPLLHLVRNAVSHGIEAPDARERAGKPREGLVRLSAWQQGDQVHIQVSDDGAGIDRSAIREAAVAKGLISREAVDALSDEDCLRFIFEPGFSTSRTVNDISGRGVGMDVVKTSIEELHGEVRVESVVGAGACITLALPLTLAISRALLIRSQGRMYAVPTMSVDSTTKVGARDVKSVEGREAIIVRGATVPILHLAAVLGLNPAGRAEPAAQGKQLNVVVVAYALQRFGLVVDEMIGEQEIVVKPLAAPLPRVKNIAGAAILGSGEVITVLHVPDVAATARSLILREAARLRGAAPAAAPRKTVLVVEDSLTAREIERGILEAAGYRVVTAQDGAEGMQKASGQTFDLIVTDVQMPRMDGFELTRRLKAEERFRRTPIIIVTSRGDEADRKRGLEAGADAYLVKSAMQHGDLLECARRLIG